MSITPKGINSYWVTTRGVRPCPQSVNQVGRHRALGHESCCLIGHERPILLSGFGSSGGRLIRLWIVHVIAADVSLDRSHRPGDSAALKIFHLESDGDLVRMPQSWIV